MTNLPLPALPANILQSAGFDVLTANSAEEAKQVFALHTGSIALLITDVVMPGQSGPDLANELTRESPDLRVLLVSGYCDSAHVQCFSFLRKPFSTTELLQSVAEFTAVEAA
jgi:two-component system cell cycle sensor histidine kinase/response regulator CckA